MCGFAGFTGYLADGDAVLERMMNKIIHRGPDSAGKYIDDKAYMGFRRLSIIDLDNGSQPMFNENKKIVITFNGEIYNYQDLRKTLLRKVMYLLTIQILKFSFTHTRSMARTCLTSFVECLHS